MANETIKVSGTKSGYQPELDGIRGLAILGVLATHSTNFIALTHRTRPLLVSLYFGQWGVDLFFALSGFLITGILLRTKTAPNYFSSFYTRRILRIWPIYYGVLALLFSATLFSRWAVDHMPPRHEWLSYLVYLQNVPVFWANQLVPSSGMIGHFWSLAVEEQFYLVWPLAVLLVSEEQLQEICFIGIGFALPLRIFMLHFFRSSWGEMIITTARMDGLFIGAAYAILLWRFKRLSWKFVLFPAIAGLFILAWIRVFHRTGEFLGSGPHMRTFGVTAIALLSGALIALSQRHIPVVDSVLTMRWLRLLGRYSYGIYVFHLPIFLFAAQWVAPHLRIKMPASIGTAVLFILAANIASIAVAVASFELFESKILRLKDRFEPKPPVSSETLKQAVAS